MRKLRLRQEALYRQLRMNNRPIRLLRLLNPRRLTNPHRVVEGAGAAEGYLMEEVEEVPLQVQMLSLVPRPRSSPRCGWSAARPVCWYSAG